MGRRNPRGCHRNRVDRTHDPCGRRAGARRPRPRGLAGPDRGQHARQAGRAGRPVDARAHRPLSAAGRGPAAHRLPARSRPPRRTACGCARSGGSVCAAASTAAPRRRRRLRDPRSRPPGDPRLRLQYRAGRRPVAAAAAVPADVHRRAGRLPQPDGRAEAAADGDLRQPVPGVDRRADPRRHLRLDLPGTPPPRRGPRPPGRGALAHRQRRVRRDVRGRADRGGVHRADGAPRTRRGAGRRPGEQPASPGPCAGSPPSTTPV